MNSAIKTLAILMILIVGVASFQVINISENFNVKLICAILFGVTIAYPTSDYWIKKFKL